MIVKLFLQKKDKKVKGPIFSGDSLKVTFVDSDKDGINDIVVKSGLYPSHFAVVKLRIKNGEATGFHVSENHDMCIGFPEEGFYCP